LGHRRTLPRVKSDHSRDLHERAFPRARPAGIRKHLVSEAISIRADHQCGSTSFKDPLAASAQSRALGRVDSWDSLDTAKSDQGSFFDGCLGCDAPFGFKRCGVGSHRSTSIGNASARVLFSYNGERQQTTCVIGEQHRSFGEAEYFFLDRRIGGNRRSGDPKRTHCVSEIGSRAIIGSIGEAR
jgi:hypothetical protein